MNIKKHVRGMDKEQINMEIVKWSNHLFEAQIESATEDKNKVAKNEIGETMADIRVASSKGMLELLNKEQSYKS